MAISDAAEETVDVLICGSGSAGLACALWLAIYNHRYTSSDGNHAGLQMPITYRILESRNGPLQLGQADGVQCRTVEIYESFGLDHLLKAEGYWVNEITFWALDDSQPMSDGTQRDKSTSKRLVRTGRTPDVQPGLSHQPHLILNQARINALMLEKIQELNNGSANVDYSWKVTHIETDPDSNSRYPVKGLAEKEGQTRIIRARYALGGDGAHSQVRHSLGIPMEGDSTNAVWGVMDVFPQTDFPDVRKKCTIRSEVGTLMIIPREGDVMVRMYFELPHGTNPKSVTLEELHRRAKEMLKPFQVEFLRTKWWSAYVIGQRVAKSMVDESGHIFLSGDACHTHSPKAGQGMNASLQDGYNIGWKLGAILTGQADESILKTYVQERHQYARQLINFDRYFAKLFSAGGNASPEEFNKAFIQAGVFTAGMAANYKDSDLTDNITSKQDLAGRVVVGERLPSAQVVRLSDSKPFPLLKLLQSDGRWRLLVFAGNVDHVDAVQRANKVGEQLLADGGLLKRFTPSGAQPDAVIETLLIFGGDRKKVEFDQLHDAFKPGRHDLPITNLHKVFFDDESWNWGHGRAYDTLNIAKEGCIIVARPDQYVSAVVDFDDLPKLSAWFEKFLRSKV